MEKVLILTIEPSSFLGGNSMKYSHSRLTTFDSCMRKGYYIYIVGRSTPSGLPAIIGKIFHTSSQYMFQLGFSPVDATRASIYEHGGLPEGETANDMIRMAYNAYNRVNQLIGEYAEVTSEIHLEAELAPGVVVQGFLDIAIEDLSKDEILIVDYKTSWVPYDANKTHQLRLYALLYTIIRNNMLPSVFRGRLVFPRLNEGDNEILITEDMMNETKAWVLEIVNRINEAGSTITNFPMTSNKRNCELCPFTSLCAASYVEGLPASGTPADHIEAEAIGDYIVMQELQLKKMKEGLKNYIKVTESVETLRGTWEFKFSEPSPKISIDDLKTYAAMSKQDITEVMALDNKKVMQWLESDATGFLSSHASFTSPRSTFVFTPHSNNEEDFVEEEMML